VLALSPTLGPASTRSSAPLPWVGYVEIAREMIALGVAPPERLREREWWCGWLRDPDAPAWTWACRAPGEERCRNILSTMGRADCRRVVVPEGEAP
jgi:hypothetical protein